MNKWLVQSIAPFATVAMMLGIAVLCGCEKKPDAPMARGEDPAYQKALGQSRARQNEKAAVRSRIVSQMETLVARARAALPAGATDEQIRRELESCPEKYPGWRSLSSALEKVNADLRTEMGNARATVRARILKEVADRRSAAEGRVAEKASATAK